MKKNSLVFLSLLAAFTSQAQVKDTAFAAVRYTFTYLSDTTMPAETENMILYLGRNTSEYKSYDRMLSDSVIKEQLEKLKNVPAESMGSVRIGNPGMKRGNGGVIYKDMAGTKMQRVENFLKNYLIDEPMPVINWNMTQETKKIQELDCQKATATFRGRTYNAWFTNQLPYSNGPWKLGGLPGLILEAYDDEKQVVFRFENFENVGHRHIPISLPADVIVATEKEYKQLREFAAKDPQGYLNNVMSADMKGGSVSGGGINVVSGSPRAGLIPGSAPTRRRVLNNPIERVQ
jgi:GLPGLI family protein